MEQLILVIESLCQFYNKIQSDSTQTGISLNPIDFILHLDTNLEYLLSRYGTYFYLILFLIVFCETGLVITPFLPGDSLLFAAGALAANEANNLNLFIIMPLLIAAALLGDNTNYFIGKFLAKKGEGARLFGLFTIRKDYLDKTHAFYEKHGPRTIIMARFVPIVRTFAPFVAGVGSMTYSRFIAYCIMGAVLWVVSISALGFWLGSNEIVKNNFELVVFGIIFISLIPIFVSIIKHKLQKK